MATAAELMRARLAKYKLPADPGVSDAKVKQSPVGVQATVQAPDAGVSRSLDVVTELQPTTLVVVERPVETTPAVTTESNAVRHETNLDTTNPVHVNFLQRLSDLEAAFLARDPLMRTHLKVIHTTMMDYEEIANLLTVQEISQIMAAQQVHTNTVLKQDVLKTSKAKANSKAAQLGLSDI